METTHVNVPGSLMFNDTQHSTMNQSSVPRQPVKKGRKAKWTPSRERVLGRLYLYSNLPTEKIVQVLQDKNEEWKPADISVVHKVRALLDREPNWLRPKTREQMNERVLGLEEGKARRKFKRDFASATTSDAGDRQLSPVAVSAEESVVPPEEFDDATFSEDNRAGSLPLDLFTETPIQDVLSEAPNIPQRYSLLSHEPYQDPGKLSDDAFTAQYAEESILPDSWDSLWSWQESIGHLQAPEARRGVREVSVSSTLRRRLSTYSSLYVQAISRIVKAHSVTGSSAAPSVTSGPCMSIASYNRTISQASTIRPDGPKNTRTEPNGPKLIMSGSFLNVDQNAYRQGVCLPGITAHDTNRCWCISQLVDSNKLWVSEAGLVSQNAIRLDQKLSLYNIDLKFVDAFGNTALHMLAAKGAPFETLIEMLKAGVAGNAKNTSGQSFLHLLSKRTARELVKDQEMLLNLLQTLNGFNVKFSDCDHLGRNFFHRLSYAADKSVNRLAATRALNFYAIPARDVAGWDLTHDPLIEEHARSKRGFCHFYSTHRHGRRSYENVFQEPFTVPSIEKRPTRAVNPRPPSKLMNSLLQGMPTTGNDRSISDVLLYDNIQLTPEERGALLENARLLKTAAIALDEPTVEDSEGRNGLQCIAEVLLVIAPGSTKNPRKRQAQDSPTPAGPNKSWESKPMEFRYELVWNLINVGVDRNNYDRQGNTVLIAFVTHLSDGKDDKNLQRIFQALIQTGANVHWRNRQGETALHVAVRLGRKVATKILLESNANVHARTAEGKGVMEIGETHYFKARDNPKLYTSIKACMALCRDYGAVAAPTMVQEWMVRN